ncbi:unnamed protein product [Rhizopus stolonifer]
MNPYFLGFVCIEKKNENYLYFRPLKDSLKPIEIFNIVKIKKEIDYIFRTVAPNTTSEAIESIMQRQGLEKRIEEELNQTGNQESVQDED